ncbi:YtzI protein [Caldalkalibacillus mannanilyticus]|uniref:YtzI protein n=1 Tax=Caldalkalibacillus mannanilyticus TaxID=1418 RepID=UPI000A6604FB|nr:YtzI protein [Caldalkalibacillus mannanilyticus]
MKVVMILSFVIIFAVIGLTILVTNRAYAYKHEVDPLVSQGEGVTEGEQVKRASEL